MAAAAHLGPAIPAPVKRAFHDNVRSKQACPFDARLLTEKLKAAKIEQDAALLRRRKREATKTGGYVPQNAAKQFASTTTQTNNAAAEALKRSHSTQQMRHQQKRQAPFLTVPDWTVDGKPCINPKKVIAALNMGMSESEAVASPPLKRYSLYPTDVEDVPGESAKVESSQDKTEQPERRARILGYRPGDAANRRSALIATRQSSITLHQDMPEYRVPRDKDNEMPYNLEMPADEVDEQPQALQRPRLQPHDRPDWSQQSQCGGDATQQLLSVPVLHRKGKAPKQRNAGQPQSGLRNLLGEGTSGGSEPQFGRYRSVGDLPDNLISNAVQRIKKEERVRRRQSLIALFKRS